MATLPTLFAARPRCMHCGSTETIKLATSSHYASTSKTSQSKERVNIKNKLVRPGLVQHLKIPHHKHHFRVCAMSRVSVEEVDQTYTVNLEADKRKKGLDYRFRTETGGQVMVSVKKINGKYAVNVDVSSLQLPCSNGRLFLSWGVYRSDSTCCQALDFKKTGPDAKSVTFENPFTQISVDRYALELEFELEQDPCFLSFLLKSVSDDCSDSSDIRSHRHTKFCVPVGFGPGKPSPLGLSFPTNGTSNFAIFSREVEGVVLCLYDKMEADGPALELDLDPYVNCTGDIWHVSLENTRNFTGYSYRIKGKNSNLILDPYAKVVGNSKLHGTAPASNCLGLLSKVPTFDWSGDVRPNLPNEKLIVYRLNVLRFTEHKSSELPADIAGTFSGLVEKLDHLKGLGVNSVILEPVVQCDEQKGPYYPKHFFSLRNLSGSSNAPISTINSMKEAVKRLHSSGIEVLLEVVFTHTAETGALQGINDSYCYSANELTESVSSLNCNFSVVQELILDSLRHWVTEFHIDGFCFINASALLRGVHGETLSRPPLVEAIAFDPILSRTKIIADCWDPTDQPPYEETQFPHWNKWAEMNTKFCFDIRNFLRGEGLLSDLATRLCGSGDIFLDGRGPSFSFNFISRNSGLSLVDLVSFSKDEELSWNCGQEGATDKKAVLERRLKQIRNFLFILYVSLGVPVLNMGDDCGESTGGSTTYLDRKPYDWKALKTGFGIQTTQFISFLSSFRIRRGELLQKRTFLKEDNIDWYGSDQSSPKWDDPSCKFLAMTLKAEKTESKCSEASSVANGDLFIAFNAGEDLEKVILPSPPEGMAWNRLVDTALSYPGFFSEDGEPMTEQMEGLAAYEMKSHSCALFEAKAVAASDLTPPSVQVL